MTDAIAVARTRAVDLVYWKDAKSSGLALCVGLVAFYVVGVMGWSSLGTACLVLAGHLALRLAYYNLMAPRPSMPADWISEAEVQEQVAAITKTINAAAKAAFALTCGANPALTTQWIGGLAAVALLCRLLTTTGLLFSLFVAAFAVPRTYEAKQAEIDAALVVASTKARELRDVAFVAVKEKVAKAFPSTVKSPEAEKKKL